MYYVIEHNTRKDGIINVSEVARSTFAGALAYFYDRLSRAAASEDFTSSAIMLVDADLNIKKIERVTTE